MKIVAKVLLFDDKDKTLVLRRSKTHPHFALDLDFPGGEAEIGEPPINTIKREVEEETGLQLSDAELVYEKNISDHEKHLIFVSKLEGGHPEVKLSWEHDQAEWLSVAELLARKHPRNVDAYYMTVIEYLKHNT